MSISAQATRSTFAVHRQAAKLDFYNLSLPLYDGSSKLWRPTLDYVSVRVHGTYHCNKSMSSVTCLHAPDVRRTYHKIVGNSLKVTRTWENMRHDVSGMESAAVNMLSALSSSTYTSMFKTQLSKALFTISGFHLLSFSTHSSADKNTWLQFHGNWGHFCRLRFEISHEKTVLISNGLLAILSSSQHASLSKSEKSIF